MRVVLISSIDLRSWHDVGRREGESSAPLGVLSLAAVLRQRGHTVSVVDLGGELDAGRLPSGPAFYPAAAECVAQLEPELLGISAMGSSYHLGLRLAEAVKVRRPGTPVILGGPQASVVDAATLEHFPFVDFILRGEAELTLPEFLEELGSTHSPSHTRGLTSRRDGGIVRNPEPELLPDLDTLPMPAYDLFPDRAANSGAIDAGRGCPFRCSFCSTSTYWRRRFRLKSIPRILAEMRYLRDRFGTKVFSFQHDLFTFQRERVREFCQALQGEHWEVQWSCSARVDTVSAELLNVMAEAGCCGIFYGIETGSPRLQREVHKGLHLERVLPVIEATVRAGIAPTASFICGFPTETLEDLKLTFQWLETLLGQPRTNVQLHLLGPEPGAPDYQRYRDRLRYDGYYSDIAGTAYAMTEPAWFQRHPDLFSSFYYYESDELPRHLLRRADLFIHGICAPLRTVLPLLLRRGGGLWQLYLDWTAWCAREGRIGGPSTGQALDELLMDFHGFIETLALTGAFTPDAGAAVADAILAFYLRNYGEMPVREVAPGQPIPGAEARELAGVPA